MAASPPVRLPFVARAFLRPATVALLAFALTATATSALAQRPAEVELEVVDGQGAPVADVKVTVLPADGGNPLHEGVTSKKGKHKASIDGPAGSYLVRLEKEGFGVEEVKVDLQPGMTATARVPLVDADRKRKSDAIATFNEGVALIQAGNENAAYPKFQEAVKLDPDLAEGHRLVALIAANRNDFETAGASLDRYLELKPDGLSQVSPAAYMVYRKRGDTERMAAAREGLKEVGAASDIAGRVFNEGVAAVREEDLAAARAAFQEALLIDPTLAPAYQSLAALHFNAKEFEQALPYLEKLFGVAPKHPEGLRMAFFSHLALGHQEEAAAVAKRWFEAVKNGPDQAVAQAKRLFEANQNGDARKLLEVVIAADSNVAVAHYELGKVLAAQGDAAGAKQHLQHFLQLAPDHPEAAAAKQMLEGL